MIVTRLFGGLGNQMFIYAMARALALRNSQKLVLDVDSGFERDFIYHRKFVLNTFAIKYKTNKFLTFNFISGRIVRKSSEILGRHILNPMYRYMKEKSDSKHFENKWIIEPQRNVILSGYWQSEKYFKDYEQQIRADFTFVKTFSKDVIDQTEMIKNTRGTPVALGIRLYQECPNSSKINHHILGRDYYKKAMDYICKNIPNAIFYIFTQVPEWAEKNLDKKFQYIIIPAKDGNESAVDDLYLMTCCKHHIISNSSFYWWGAWLANKGGIVVAPIVMQNKDFIPENWIVL
jgi:hypothetical protein